METKTITIGEKSFTISEIKYKDVTALNDKSQAEASKILLMSSTGITEEQFDSLTMKEGIEIQKVINEINGLDSTDFQKPLENK